MSKIKPPPQKEGTEEKQAPVSLVPVKVQVALPTLNGLKTFVDSLSKGEISQVGGFGLGWSTPSKEKQD